MAGGWPSWVLRSAAMIAVALPGMSRRRARLSAALSCARVSVGGPGRVRCPGQQLQRVGGVQVLKCRQCRGEVLPQLVPQPLCLPGPFPDHRLVSTGHYLDRALASGLSPATARS